MTIGKLTIHFWRPQGRYQWTAYLLAVAIGITGICLANPFDSPRMFWGFGAVVVASRIVDRIEELPR